VLAAAVMANRLSENPDVRVLAARSGYGRHPGSSAHPGGMAYPVGNADQLGLPDGSAGGARGRVINEPRGKVVGGSNATSTF